MIRIPSLSLAIPRLDGEPRRSHSCVNLRHEEKALVDLLGAWWSARMSRPLRQPDVMSHVLALVLTHPAADLPPGLVEPSWDGES